MTSSSSKRGEFAVIADLFAPLATHKGAYRLTDDAATLTPPRGHELVITTDALVEGVHFLPGDRIARKALRVNLSDLAAKGAEPIGYLVALSLPRNIRYAWLKTFARDLAKDQEEFGISLLGGDTTSTPGPLTIAITAIGHVPKGKMLLRKGAKPGDRVFVSGAIGDAGAGLALLKKGRTAPKALIDRYRLPTPRLALGKALRGVATAALDVSDGLIADLGHISEVSKVRILVEATHIPTAHDPVFAATAGDDYEIAFTAPAGTRIKGTTEIGRVARGRGVALLDAKGREIPLKKQGYTHF